VFKVVHYAGGGGGHSLNIKALELTFQKVKIEEKIFKAPKTEEE